MKKLKLGLMLGVLWCLIVSVSSLSAANKVLTMSTTTSTQASGLLDILLPEFKKDSGISIKVIAKGTGAAIRDGIDGNVDVIFVHAKGREHKFVADGYGTKRYAVMHNDFVILGPDSDPAGISGMRDVTKALKKIAKSKSIFVSRGDDSGTHTKEQQLWKDSGLMLNKTKTSFVKKGKSKSITYVHPQGAWYSSIGQGMSKVLTYAEEKQGYTMSDRGTFIKFKYGRTQGYDLNVLCEGDVNLFNPYGIIPVNPQKHPHVKYDLAKQFAEWLVSARAQKLIGDYKLVGKQLFYPDAIN